MISARRLFGAAVALAVILTLQVLAVDYAAAGVAAGNAAKEMERLGPSNWGSPDWWKEDLRRAASNVPRDPVIRELLGLAKARGTNDPQELAGAREDLVSAIALRPGSGYTWAGLAVVKYKLGQTDAAFEKALVIATTLGPFEPEVQRDVADYGLAMLDEVGPATRVAIEQAVARGMKRNPAEMLQISVRRGRLSVACRYWDGVIRPSESRWTKLCQSVEAT